MPPRPQSPQTNRGQVTCIYGLESVGKSTLACNFPDATLLYDPHESGVERLLRKSLVPQIPIQKVQNYTDLLRSLDDLRNDPHQTVIIEGLTGLDRMATDYHIAEYYHNNPERFYDFMKGPKAVAQDTWPKFMAACDALASQGKHVIITGHALAVPYKNPLGPDYDRFKISIDDRIYQVTKAWLANLWFLHYAIDVVTHSKPKQGVAPPKGKALQTGLKRSLHTMWNPAFDAKSMAFPAEFVADDPKTLVEHLLHYL